MISGFTVVWLNTQHPEPRESQNVGRKGGSKCHHTLPECPGEREKGILRERQIPGTTLCAHGPTQPSQAPLHTLQSAIPGVLTIFLFHSSILILKLHELCTALFPVGLQTVPAPLDQFFIFQS